MGLTRPTRQPLLRAALGLFFGAAAAAASDNGRLRLELPENLSGFWEVRAGARTQPDPHATDLSLAETRLQLRYEAEFEAATVKLVPDFLYDGVDGQRRLDLETGQGWLDLREANALFRPGDALDLKIGRQILTWGTGDLLFINDLFPKDWNAFFSGRDQEYLKAPSDAVKLSLFHDLANLDLVFTPCFDPDRFIDGRRISYWNAARDDRAGDDAIVAADRPNRWFRDFELAARLYRNLHGYELALYGYRGFWKSPAGSDPATGNATFPDLNVLGASARGTVGRGIGHAEIGWYDSANDRAGDDPLVRNSELRLLLGYEQELWPDFTAGVQYYLEWMQQYGAYRDALPPGAHAADEFRHVTTLRLTQSLLQQNLTCSLFLFLSPSDHDAYLRPSVNYKLTDTWQAEAGANLFFGEDPWSFFGQFERNNNLYASLRASF
ncbi:MAG: hypothetical protein WC789_05315 [Lentisphaeria bacterium]|jgi:hypothetical protein